MDTKKSFRLNTKKIIQTSVLHITYNFDGMIFYVQLDLKNNLCDFFTILVNKDFLNDQIQSIIKLRCWY